MAKKSKKKVPPFDDTPNTETNYNLLTKTTTKLLTKTTIKLLTKTKLLLTMRLLLLKPFFHLLFTDTLHCENKFHFFLLFVSFCKLFDKYYATRNSFM